MAATAAARSRRKPGDNVGSRGGLPDPFAEPVAKLVRVRDAATAASGLRAVGRALVKPRLRRSGQAPRSTVSSSLTFPATAKSAKPILIPQAANRPHGAVRPRLPQ